MAKKPSKPHVTLSYSKDPAEKVARGFLVAGWNSTGDEWVISGAWVGVISSNVAAIRYDRKERDLYVQFSKSGHTYVYTNVTSNVARDMYYVNSMGSFVHQRLIGGRYAHRLAHWIARIVSPTQMYMADKMPKDDPMRGSIQAIERWDNRLTPSHTFQIDLTNQKVNRVGEVVLGSNTPPGA